MATVHELAIERLESAVVDGRTENVRYRQDQLQSLHKTLREEASAICRALSQDSRSSSVEVEAEFYLAMDTVRHSYETLDFDKELEEEYNVARGQDNKSRRVGAGLVVIRPTSHTRFYSIVNPVAAAISAGNCVILELQDTLLEVDAVLRLSLPKVLDANTFYISNKVISEKEILDSAAVLVDQTSRAPSVSLTSQLLSSSGTRTVAIVDRTAIIEHAAKAITTARFSFGGTSPYAPDLVLVNEFVKQEFFEACSKYATLSFAKESTVNKVSRNHNEASTKAVKEAEDKRQVSSFGSDDFKLVDILDKNTPVMNMKISGRYLPIATCSSLVDAVFAQQFENPLLAGYFFAEPRSAKYLSQHLSCHISLINQIPIQLLMGPAAPIAHNPDILYRYNKAMFSLSRPQFIEPGPAVFRKAEEAMLGGGDGKKTVVSAQSIRALATKPLKPTGQPKKEMLGFFETGFFIGAGITLALPLFGWASYLATKRGLGMAMRMQNLHRH